VVENRLSHSFSFRRFQPQSQALAFRRGWFTLSTSLTRVLVLLRWLAE
jgi:hypothetical protein